MNELANYLYPIEPLQQTEEENQLQHERNSFDLKITKLSSGILTGILAYTVISRLKVSASSLLSVRV